MRNWAIAVLVGPVLGLSVSLWLVTADAIERRAEIERLEAANLTLRVEVDALRRKAIRKERAADLIPPQTLPTGVRSE